jgi:holo-[acyl-carrier protein] synthase
VSVDTVAQSIHEGGRRYLERLFTERELADCDDGRGGYDAARLAGRFAAKEAALKALRSEGGVSWLSIEVIRDPAGWVDLALTGPAADRASETGVVGVALSLSHEDAFAVAVVVAELDRETG